MIKKDRLIYLSKIIILSLLFYGAITFENAKGSRLYLLMLIFGIYLVIGIIRLAFLKKSEFRKNKALVLTFILDIASIYLLEHYSRFQINYFFHSFYIILLLEISVILDRKNSLMISIITVIISLIKYTMLVNYMPNLVNISQMAFFTLLNILILIIAAFAQYYRKEKEKTDKLYKELLHTHKRLKEYADEVEKLTIIEERNRIARDIHDTLGHSMTAIIMEIEMAYHLMNDDLDKAKQFLDNAKASSREGLVKIREVVETLKPDDKIIGGISSIKELICEFSSKTGIDINLKINGNIIKVSYEVNLVLYRTIQEALTNAVRHGKAAGINVLLQFSNKQVNFIISDNGLGCNDVIHGFGLKGMKERINSLNGKLETESNDGFTVKGYLPIGG